LVHLEPLRKRVEFRGKNERIDIYASPARGCV